MLVLSCNINKSIRINDNITITVLAVDLEHVKLKISTPSGVSILRREVYLQIKNGDNQKSGKLAPPKINWLAD
jgi:carbon storage regulator